MARDRGLLLGDGLFETVLANQGRLILFDEHAARLIRGCASLGLPAPDPGRLRNAANAAVATADLTEARAAVRLTWSAGDGGRGLDRPPELSSRLFATAAAAPRSTEPVTLMLSDIRRNPTSPTSRLKTLAYLDNVMARRQATTAGAGEALMLNTAGEIAGAAAANVFWIREGRLFTPVLSCGVLDGIMRAQAMRRAVSLGVTTVEAREDLTALIEADGVFLTNSLIGIRPVDRFQARTYSPHALTARLAEALAADL